MKIYIQIVALVVCGFLAAPSFASEYGFDWVSVGDPGNPGDPTVRFGGESGFGSVDYSFNISKSPVTNSQYIEFLNSVATVSDPGGLYDIGMEFFHGGILRNGTAGNYSYVAKTRSANKPVNFVDVYDSMRFVNWVNNGRPVGLQGIGTTESGSYTITQTGIDLNEITRNLGSGLFLPTEDEWYKAAFYEPGASGDSYWNFPTRSDRPPSPGQILSNGDLVPGENIANSGSVRGILGIFSLANVGTAGPLSESYYGVADMAGHVREWTESIITLDEFPNPPASNPPSNGTWRSIMGGAWATTVAQAHFRSFYREPEDPFDGDSLRGFRLVSITVPEPSSLALSSFLFMAATAGRRRRV